MFYSAPGNKIDTIFTSRIYLFLITTYTMKTLTIKAKKKGQEFNTIF